MAHAERRIVLTGFLSVLLVILCAGVTHSTAAQSPTISVIISEEYGNCPRPPDPPAQVALRQKLIDGGYYVVTSNADIAVQGEGFVECILRADNLWHAKARVEITAVERTTSRVLASESVHAGGIETTARLAMKRALERAGERLGDCIIAKLGRGWSVACKYRLELAVDYFEVRDRTEYWDARVGLKEMVEKALSDNGYKVVPWPAGDVVVSGVVTSYRTVYTLDIPIIGWFLSLGASYMTVEPDMFDLGETEIRRGDPIVEFAAGVQILGIKFGFGPEAVARKISEQIATWVEFQVK